MVEKAGTLRTLGFGVRLIVDGAWGFAGSVDLSSVEILSAVERAVKVARASSRVKKKDIKLAPLKADKDKYRTPLERRAT